MDYYPVVAGFDEAGTLELAHLLGDGLPCGEDHVRQILVREAHLESCARVVGLPKRSPRCESNVARRADTSLSRRLSIVSSDCLRCWEKVENSFRANSGRRFMTSLRTDFRTTATRASVIASAKAFWQDLSSRLSSPKTSPSVNSAVVASL